MSDGDTNVVLLHGEERAPAPGDPNHGIIVCLRDALMRAEKGDIQHILICYADGDGNTGRTFDGKPQYILYAMEQAKKDLLE